MDNLSRLHWFDSPARRGLCKRMHREEHKPGRGGLQLWPQHAKVSQLLHCYKSQDNVLSGGEWQILALPVMGRTDSRGEESCHHVTPETCVPWPRYEVCCARMHTVQILQFSHTMTTQRALRLKVLCCQCVVPPYQTMSEDTHTCWPQNRQ